MSALKLVRTGAPSSLPRDLSMSAERSPEDHRVFVDRLSTHLRVGATRRKELLAEIEAHLTDRTRDLMVAGMSEPEAAKLAAIELGDPALLAARLGAALAAPRRRRLVNIGMILVASVGLSFAVTGLVRQPRESTVEGVSVFQPPAAAHAADEKPVIIDANQTWSSVFTQAGKAASLPVQVLWNHLQSLRAELGPDGVAGVEFRAPGMPLNAAIAFLNDALSLTEDDRIDYRVQNGTLVFASSSYFDRQESTLVTFDLTTVVNATLGEQAPRQDSVRRVMQSIQALITSLVHPTIWAERGGDRGVVTFFGAKLFVRAPQRVQPQIQWVLDEVAARPAVPQSRASDGQGVAVEFKLVPRLTVLDSSGASALGSAAPASRAFELDSMKAKDLREILGAIFELSPALQSCPVPRGLVITAGTSERLEFSATESQVRTVSDLVAILDRPVPKTTHASGDTRSFPLSHIDATRTAALLNAIFGTSPYLANCPTPRSIAIETSTNSVIFGSTSDQVDAVGKIIELIDRPAPTLAGAR
ncbi:MAG: hypothetical protein JNM07_02960 [Phycisphaerae bacterium]|nr:hypothetical protein [Phycisphaerae bacterium]